MVIFVDILFLILPTDRLLMFYLFKVVNIYRIGSIIVIVVF